MNFLSRIFGAFRGATLPSSQRYLPIYVYSHRCREPITGHVDLMNEISLAEEGGAFYVRKVLHTSGKHRCFAEVEVELWLDEKKQIREHQVKGGRWLTAEEYARDIANQTTESGSEPAEPNAG